MGQDLWRFQRWAREQKLGNATRKLILTSLAITAESSSGSGFMSQGDLAEYAECSIRTVSAHLKALEAVGLLERQRRFSTKGRRLADGFLLLMPGVTEWPNGEPVTNAAAPPEDFSSGHFTSSPPEVQGAEQEQPFEQPILRENGRAHAIDTVWGHYQKTVPNGERYKLDHQRRLIITKALKVRSVEECCRAIDGLAASEYHVSNGYLDIKYALVGGGRSPSVEGTIDRLAAQAANGTTNGRHSAAGSATVGRRSRRAKTNYNSGIIWEDEEPSE